MHIETMTHCCLTAKCNAIQSQNFVYCGWSVAVIAAERAPPLDILTVRCKHKDYISLRLKRSSKLHIMYYKYKEKVQIFKVLPSQ